jgi:hypothetical protein
VSERYDAGTPEPEMGRYHIILETEVTSPMDLVGLAAGADDLAGRIDTAWCYVFGEPFSATWLQLVAQESPDGWSGNYREVDKALRKHERIQGDISIKNTRWYKSPVLPLAKLLTVCDAMRSAEPLLQELIGLHVTAHRSSAGRQMMFAKAIEVVGRYHGITRIDRNAGIQNEMVSLGLAPHLKQSIEWLFEIANTRFDIRHAVDNKAAGVALHPRLQPEERNEFEHDANLVIGGFVCRQLGLPGFPFIMF